MDATTNSKKNTFLTISLFVKRLYQFRSVCKVGVRVTVSIATVESVSLLQLSIEESPLLLSVANVNSQQLYVFEMNNKAPPPINTSNKCSYHFPPFPHFRQSLSWRRNCRLHMQVLEQDYLLLPYYQ
jgi:hypothetical protein